MSAFEIIFLSIFGALLVILFVGMAILGIYNKLTQEKFKKERIRRLRENNIGVPFSELMENRSDNDK